MHTDHLMAEPVTVSIFSDSFIFNCIFRYLKEYQRTFAIPKRSQPISQWLSTNTFKFESTVSNHSRIHSYERFILIFFRYTIPSLTSDISPFRVYPFFSSPQDSTVIASTPAKAHLPFFHLYLPYYYNSSKINIPMQLCKLHRSYLEINSP